MNARSRPQSQSDSPSAQWNMLHGIPSGAEALALAERQRAAPGIALHVCHSDRDMEKLRRLTGFFMPDVDVIALPAWDCLPYDRVSPHAGIMAERIAALVRLTHLCSSPLGGEQLRSSPQDEDRSVGGEFSPHTPHDSASAANSLASSAPPQGGSYLALTTAAALIQKLPPRSLIENSVLTIEKSKPLNLEKLKTFLEHHGYHRTGKVMEPGEYALRGSLIDLFPSGQDDAIRIDLFGEEIESIRTFDPLTQRSDRALETFSLYPASEVMLNEKTILRFRERYREMFGAPHREDALYAAISAGQRYPGMEHWLPLFYEKLDTIFDYLPEASITLDHQLQQTLQDRTEMIGDYYQARTEQITPKGKQTSIYHPVPPEALYLPFGQIIGTLHTKSATEFSPLSSGSDAGYRRVEPVHPLARQSGIAPIEKLIERAEAHRQEKKAMLVCCYTKGSLERVKRLLDEVVRDEWRVASNWQDISSSLRGALATKQSSESAMGATKISCAEDSALLDCRVGAKAPPRNDDSRLFLTLLPLEQGFITPNVILYSEQDIFGARLTRTKTKKKTSEVFMQEAASFEIGELLVHKDHGIGRFEGLVTIETEDIKHDCLKLVYRDDGRLFLPVENMDLITRFGSETEGVELDRLGAAQWQARKAAMKEKIKMAAAELMQIAAMRAVRPAPKLAAATELYESFAARFPYQETEDQDRSINEVLEDLVAGRPMDRLVCGDVGFGKTEVALRAAYAAAQHGAQVALIAPTTLLVRQHYRTFSERFEGTGLRIGMLSRLTKAHEAKKVKEGLKDGAVQIAIGTHALLASGIEFHNLGLMIIDEEQHFGVKQKERLKQLRADVHVLTLSATPIPRTLQMALTGVKELSLITTPPVDRLAVRSFVMPYDPVIIKEAIQREMHRGGQVFYVTPRIVDIPELRERIKELIPDVRLAVAHGQMAATELDKVMNGFYDGKYDVLLSTAIIESGLDIPTANTLIVNRSDRFGLSQLYQLRGRVGRSKVRAYAYFTLPPNHSLTTGAVKRLEVMQSLDTLGAGFTLASHDMDIRGFGNLLGEEQSGHVREIGVELYQQMLEEAVENLKHEHGVEEKVEEEKETFSPQINLGLPVLIPEAYVDDLSLRLSLYRRLTKLQTDEEIEAFAAELIDRFGPLPKEVDNLLAVLKLKRDAAAANIERIDTGPKGAIISFRNNTFANPEALLGYLAKHSDRIKLRPDQKLFCKQEYGSGEDRLRKVQELIDSINKLST